VTEGAFPVNWIIDKELAEEGGMQISYDAALRDIRSAVIKIRKDYLKADYAIYSSISLINFPN
jgi:hypothetical protein